MLSVGIGLRLVVSLKMSREIGVLGSLLAQRRWPELFRRQLGYAVYALPAALLTALQKYAASQLGLAMRYHLSAAVHARYGASASLPLAVAGADDALQIGTADVAAFCRESVSLFEGLLEPTAEVVISSTVLASQMGTGPLLRCYLFFGAAGCWTRLVGPAIATRTADVQAAEGELLAAHARLVAYAEEVAMLRGGAAERALLDGALDHLAASTATLQLQRFGSEALDGYVLRYLGILAAFTAMMPAVYHASTAAGANDPTEYFLTCLHLLVNVGMACKDLVLSHKALAGARGMAGRVRLLLDALDTAAVAPPAAGVRRLTAAPARRASPSPPSPSARRAAPRSFAPSTSASSRATASSSPAPTAPARRRSFACSPACGRRTAAPPRCRPPSTSSSSRSGRTSSPPPRRSSSFCTPPPRRPLARRSATPSARARVGRRRLRARRRLPPRCAPLPPHPAPAPAARARPHRAASRRL